MKASCAFLNMGSLFIFSLSFFSFSFFFFSFFVFFFLPSPKVFQFFFLKIAFSLSPPSAFLPQRYMECNEKRKQKEKKKKKEIFLNHKKTFLNVKSILNAEKIREISHNFFFFSL